MKRLAESACLTLAQWIMDGVLSAWGQADRIERRFRCVGCTEAYVERMTKEHAAFLRAESLRHDNLEPNRRSYLHR